MSDLELYSFIRNRKRYKHVDTFDRQKSERYYSLLEESRNTKFVHQSESNVAPFCSGLRNASFGEHEVRLDSCPTCAHLRYLAGTMLARNDTLLLEKIETWNMFFEPSALSYIRRSIKGDRASSFQLHTARNALGDALVPIAESEAKQAPLFARMLDGQIDLPLIQRWITKCATSHGRECTAPTNGRLLERIRAIDCSNRTVVWCPENESFLTLSYVWGELGQERFALSISGNSPLPDSLPPLVNDAIYLTLSLGYRYLWVDFYCIDQRDEEDIQRQVNQMHLIYGISTATIIAASGKDPSQPLPGIQPGSRPCSRIVNIEKHPYALITLPKTESYVYFSRGWTYQEAILSRRRIVFFKDHVYFECRSGVQMESIILPEQLLTIRKSLFLFPTLRPRESEKSQKPNQVWDHEELFIQHVNDYASRNMTFDHDYLNGFVGIINALRDENTWFSHITGVPIPDRIPQTDQASHTHSASTRLAAALLWENTTVMVRRRSFPSWSWVGWQRIELRRSNYATWFQEPGELMHPVQISLQDCNNHIIRVEDFLGQINGTPSISETQIRYLHIKALTIRVSFTTPWTSSSREWIDVQYFPRRLETNLVLTENITPGEKMIVTGIILPWLPTSRMTILLVNKDLIDDGSASLKRIGIAHVNLLKGNVNKIAAVAEVRDLIIG